MSTMSSVTIVEGPDACGKTTFASTWLMDLDYRHQGRYKKDVVRETLEVLHRDAALNVVYDRLHIGERVYGPIMRGIDLLGPIRQRVIDRYLLARRVVVVRARVPVDVMLANWRRTRAERDEYVEDEARMRAIWEAYEALPETLPTVTYDYEVDDPLEVRDIMEDARTLQNRGPGVGNWAPGKVTLLVAERCNVRDDDIVHLPFIGRRYGLGDYISRKLEEFGVPERELYWVNALTPSGHMTDWDFVDRLQPRRVVTLGRIAAAWARHAGIAHVELDHPQYRRRFMHSDAWSELKEAVCM